MNLCLCKFPFFKKKQNVLGSPRLREIIPKNMRATSVALSTTLKGNLRFVFRIPSILLNKNEKTQITFILRYFFRNGSLQFFFH